MRSLDSPHEQSAHPQRRKRNEPSTPTSREHPGPSPATLTTEPSFKEKAAVPGGADCADWYVVATPGGARDRERREQRVVTSPVTSARRASGRSPGLARGRGTTALGR